MDVTPSRFFPSSKSTYILIVTEYKDKCISGILTAPLLNKSYVFRDLVQLLLLMESLMDDAKFPQHCVAPRAFQAGHITFSPRETTEKPACPLAVFDISVMFRQNASWQGSILWRSRMMESRFRSVLELVGLMDDALTAALEQ